jgi:hypothetical protein
MSVKSVGFSGSSVDTSEEQAAGHQQMEISENIGGTLSVSPATPSEDDNDGGDNKAETGEKAEEQQRPEWLPSKFKSPEELAKAYASLEKKLGNKPADDNKEAKADADADDDSEQPPVVLDDTQKDVEKAVGGEAQLTKYSQEYAETGGLSEASYKELEARGIPKTLVDTYIRGQEAIVEAQVTAIYNQVGGKEEYVRMLDWAENNLSQDEITAFNNIIAGGNQAQTKLAVNGLFSSYSGSAKSPKLINDGSPASGSRPAGNPFRSTAEVVSAMSDPRYAKDASYRRDVERRLEMSDVL